jgi:predicted dienelactone hydrolase
MTRSGSAVAVLETMLFFLIACTLVQVVGAETASTLPLTEPGPYHVGTYPVTFKDSDRGNRSVAVTVWYPAVPMPDAGSIGPLIFAEPHLGGAPYPVILSSSETARLLAPIVVSHGFTWISVNDIDTYPRFCTETVDQPLDLVFALGQIATSPPKMLQGMIDTDRAGAIGYSFDGLNALFLGGARVDPAYYLAQCPTADAVTQVLISSGLSAFDCGPANAWEEFTAHAGDVAIPDEGGLWQPITDTRIRAVMPLAAEGWWLFGARGLAALDRPTLMLVGAEDELYPENALLFEHIGAAEKTLVSFVGRTHLMMVLEASSSSQMAHFAVAFFGYHLKGQVDMAEYYSQDFVGQQTDLVWGPMQAEP